MSLIVRLRVSTSTLRRSVQVEQFCVEEMFWCVRIVMKMCSHDITFRTAKDLCLVW